MTHICAKCGENIRFAFIGRDGTERWQNAGCYFHCENKGTVFNPQYAHIPTTSVHKLANYIGEQNL